ncbi:hypothetical protein Tco_0205982 [Tanacetum coccineum]
MFVAIETRFGGNASTKKTQKTLLKQQYENFSASSAESLDSIFNRLQKIVSRLAILGVIIAQEDLNSTFLSSLPPEWNTHIVVWMNKPKVETISIDDLYNNFKIVEQKAKKSVGASSVSTASPNVNTGSPQVSTASFNDNVVYAFMVENPNGYNLLHQDLEQIHEDDLEAINLKWQLSLLSMRAKMECRASISKEGQFRNQDNTRKQGNNEDTSSKVMLAIDGVGFGWSNMAEEQVQINMALMAFSDSENEVLFSEEVAVLKREVACKDYEINVLKSEFEKVKQEKDGIEFKIEKFDKALKDLDKLLGSQINDTSKKGLGYSAVPTPHPLIYNRPKKLDLSYSDESKENSNESLVDEQVSQDTSSFVESSLNVDKEPIFYVDKKVEFAKSKNHEKPVKKSVRNMTPRAVLLKTGLTSLNTVRPVNITHPKSAVHSAKSMTHFSKQAQSTAQRPFYKQKTLTRRSMHTAKRHYYTERPRAVNTARSYTGQINAVREKGGKPQQDDKGFVDSGCSRHMTGNIAYLLDFMEFNRGYVGTEEVDWF